MDKEEGETSNKQDPTTFEFPIQYSRGMVKMKNIPPFPLPNFHGISSEDSNIFLFKFDIIC